MLTDAKVNIVRDIASVRTLQMFHLGNVWHVHYTNVTNSKKNPRLLQAINEEYPTIEEATSAYNQILNIILPENQR
jgi:nickel-dependent lactate racemase